MFVSEFSKIKREFRSEFHTRFRFCKTRPNSNVIIPSEKSNDYSGSCTKSFLAQKDLGLCLFIMWLSQLSIAQEPVRTLPKESVAHTEEITGSYWLLIVC